MYTPHCTTLVVNVVIVLDKGSFELLIMYVHSANLQYQVHKNLWKSEWCDSNVAPKSIHLQSWWITLWQHFSRFL